MLLTLAKNGLQLDGAKGSSSKISFEVEEDEGGRRLLNPMAAMSRGL